MTKPIDLTGKRFGRLAVIEKTRLDKPEANGTVTGWRCKCDCGKEIVVPARYLTTGKKNSCGCLLSETARTKMVVQNVAGHIDGTALSLLKPNRPLNTNNVSGVRGVYWSNREKRWIAKIGFKGKDITIGRFKSMEGAAAARKEAEERFYTPMLEQHSEDEESVESG